MTASWGDDTATTARCPTCGKAFIPTGRRRFCSDNCRKTGWKQIHRIRVEVPVLAVGRRRNSTVYQCDECEERYVGQQWCPDCQRPCRRVGRGGLCPACEHPVAIEDLFDPSLLP